MIALPCPTTGLKIDPDNAALKSGLQEAQAEMSRPQSPFAKPEVLVRLATDPRTKGFLAQPDFMAKFAELQRDPSSIARHMNDPRMQMVSSSSRPWTFHTSLSLGVGGLSHGQGCMAMVEASTPLPLNYGIYA